MKKSMHHLIAEVPRSITKVGMTIGIDLGDVWSHYCTCHAALKSRKLHYEAKMLHSNREIQGAFVLKSETEWMGADAT